MKYFFHMKEMQKIKVEFCLLSSLHKIVLDCFWLGHHVINAVPYCQEWEAHEEPEGAPELRHEGDQRVHPVLPLPPDLSGAVVVSPEKVAMIKIIPFIIYMKNSMGTHLADAPIFPVEPDCGSPTTLYSLYLQGILQPVVSITFFFWPIREQHYIESMDQSRVSIYLVVVVQPVQLLVLRQLLCGVTLGDGGGAPGVPGGPATNLMLIISK